MFNFKGCLTFLWHVKAKCHLEPIWGPKMVAKTIQMLEKCFQNGPNLGPERSQFGSRRPSDSSLASGALPSSTSPVRLGPKLSIFDQSQRSPNGPHDRFFACRIAISSQSRFGTDLPSLWDRFLEDLGFENRCRRTLHSDLPMRNQT